tara:strand:+ start:119 stop:304 length:186 start_codon:yes stop_codon:yes gene_type:complete
MGDFVSAITTSCESGRLGKIYRRRQERTAGSGHRQPERETQSILFSHWNFFLDQIKRVEET